MNNEEDNPSHYIADLVLVAFLECLANKETHVPLVQFHARNYSPHPQLTRDCVCFLIKQGRVSVSFIGKSRKGKRLSRGLDINTNISSNNLASTIIDLSKNLKKHLPYYKDSELLKELDDQLKIFECVEYCRYYVEKEELKLKDEFDCLHKLELMILELAQPQVYMLLWRAVKNASEIRTPKSRRAISLNDVINLAYKYFISYRKRDIQIDFYKAPYSVENSALRNTLHRFVPS